MFFVKYEMKYYTQVEQTSVFQGLRTCLGRTSGYMSDMTERNLITTLHISF